VKVCAINDIARVGGRVRDLEGSIFQCKEDSFAIEMASVADLDHFDTDPDPAFHFDTETDPTV
jgi:hypothetical protein